MKYSSNEIAMTDKWLKAAEELSQNPNSIVLCPECNKGHIKIKIEKFLEYNAQEMSMSCSECNAATVLTSKLKKPLTHFSPLFLRSRGLFFCIAIHPFTLIPSFKKNHPAERARRNQKG